MNKPLTLVKENMAVAILLLLIMVYPVCYMWQGLDVTDAGFSLANMQQFFHAYPKDLTDLAITSCWLTYLTGGAWYELTGHCGLIGFRVLYLLVIFCILGMACLPLRRYGTCRVLLAMLAATGLIIEKSFYFPSYNEVTAIWFMLTALALYYGLVRDKGLLIVAAGICGGISIFARFPNLLIAVIVVAIFFYRGIESPNKRLLLSVSAPRALRESALFGLGYVTGIGAVFLVMGALGHVSAYFDMLRGIFALAGDATSTHGSGSLLKGLVRDSAYAGGYGLLFLVAGCAVGWVGAGLRTRSLRWGLTVVTAAGLTALLLKFELLGIWFWPGLIYATLFVGALGLLRFGKEFRLLCVLSGIVLFVTPLGSGNGIFNAVYAMHLAMPVALVALIACPHAMDLETNRRGMTVRKLEAASWSLGLLPGRCIDIALVGYVALLAMLASSAVHRWHFTYRDTPERLAMRATVDHPKLRCVLTTPSRARSLEELLQHLQAFVGKDQYLLDHMQIPLIYFLTETRPYLYSTWANLYEPAAFEAAMHRALSSRPSLPVCVMTKVDTSHPRWPDESYPPQSYRRHVENRRLVDSFLQAHHYQKRWENNAFEIWLPPDSNGTI